MSDGREVIMVGSLADFTEQSPARKLAQALVSRLMVREQYDVAPEIQNALERICEEVMVLRGFDVGAEFAGAYLSAAELDPSATISQSIDRHLPAYWGHHKSQIRAAFLDLIRRPTSAEEDLLAEVGRISFGIEMVLQSGRATMCGASLPEQIYLDASVLMPAIVRGHPYQKAYEHALRKLRKAAESKGSATNSFIADVFLNEIVAHRRRAIDMLENLKLDDYGLLNRRILYYGPTTSTSSSEPSRPGAQGTRKALLRGSSKPRHPTRRRTP
jgi:hypothetical protein